MRAFVAVDLGTDRATDARASAPSHLTLRFLGEVDGPRVAPLVELLTPVGRRHAPFALCVEGVGAFPSSARPRVVWVGVTEGRSQLEELVRDVRTTLAPGFGEESSAFVPHLTLFRVRGPDELRAARELLDGRRLPPPPRRAWIDAFVLKQSILAPHGAHHRVIATFRLTGGDGSVP